MYSKPSANSTAVGKVYEDTVVAWLREVVGEAPGGVFSRRWVETPNGYLYAPAVQPVKNSPNKPVNGLPSSSSGQGFWAEVSIPYVDIYSEKNTLFAVAGQCAKTAPVLQPGLMD